VAYFYRTVPQGSSNENPLAFSLRVVPCDSRSRDRRLGWFMASHRYFRSGWSS